MSDTTVLPGALSVRTLFEDLLGRDCDVSAGDPITAADLPTAVVALYTIDPMRLYGVLGLQLSLAANTGAALGLLSPGTAADSVAGQVLFPDLAENVSEMCNVLTTLLNHEGGPHVRLHQVIFPGTPLPGDARAHLLALGRRLDLTIDINRYGGGKLSLSLVP